MKKYRKILFLFVLITSLLFTSIFTSWAGNSGPNGSQPVNLDEIRNADQSQKIVRDEKGNKVFAYGKLSKPSKNTAEIIAKDYFEANDDVIKHRTQSGRFEVDYALRAKHNNVYGKTVMEYHQAYKGIPVYNTTKYVHIDKDGAVVLESGYFKAGLETAKGLEVSPKLSSGDALNVAANELGINLGAAEKKEASLMVYAEGDNGDATYTYKVDLAYSIPEPGNWTIFVDAVKGSVVRKINNIHNDIVVGNGIGVLGDSKSFYVERDLSGLFPAYWMENNYGSGLTALNYANGTSSTGTFSTLVTTQFSDSSTSTAAAACDAYTYAYWTYYYYAKNHGRKSYDNAGTPIKVGVHYGSKVNNAYSFGGGTTVFGDGDGVTYRSFAADMTVVAHEISHEVIGVETGLGGGPQPDAINESVADTFGAMVDYYAYGDNINCWIVAKDVTLSGTGYRNLANPPAFGHPDHFSSYSDSSDCHVNCGILNKAAYLLSEGGTFHDYTVSGIGKDKTAQIYYRAITNKTIPSNATFHQFYNAVYYAAGELYGSTSAERAAVHQAFAAVGIADFWKITSVSSGKVLDIPWASKDPGVNVTIYDYVNGNNNQLWQLKYFSGGYLIRAKHSGLCLDVPDSSLASGVQIRQWYQTSNSAQRWAIISTGNNDYYIFNQCSNKYMDVKGGSTESSTPVLQWDFHGGANQRWLLEYVD
jgi:bacillolysin